MHREPLQKGFTLVELMIVVAIMGILASVTIPMYQVYVGRASNSVALSDLKNFRAIMEAYYADSQKYPEP